MRALTLKGNEYATLYRPSHFPPDEVQEGRMTCGTGNMWLQFSGRTQWYRVGRHLSEWKAKIWLDACVTVDDVMEALELEAWPPPCPTKPPTFTESLKELHSLLGDDLDGFDPQAFMRELRGDPTAPEEPPSATEDPS